MMAADEQESAMRASSDRWYEQVVRRTPGLRPGEEQQLTAALDAHRAVIAGEILGSSLGLAYLREVGAALASRAIDVRTLIELEADVRVEDARAECMTRLVRIARLTARRGERPSPRRSRPQLEREIRDLGLRRAHVEIVLGRMRAAGAAHADALRRYRESGEAGARARTRLVEAHLRLVVAIGRRYLGRGLELPDLVQEGTIGLMRAIERFDTGREVAFATYAAWWIRQTIGRALASRARPVRLPLSVEDGLRSVRKHTRHLAACAGRMPTASEVAARTRLSVARVEELARIERELCQPTVPLDDVQPGDEDGRAPIDVLPDTSLPGPEETAVARHLSAHAQRALRALPARDRQILQLRYGLESGTEHTLEEIGRQFGLTRQRILQITAKAIEKLRASRHAYPLRSFWE